MQLFHYKFFFALIWLVHASSGTSSPPFPTEEPIDDEALVSILEKTRKSFTELRIRQNLRRAHDEARHRIHDQNNRGNMRIVWLFVILQIVLIVLRIISWYKTT